MRDVYFLLSPCVLLLDLAGPADAFRLAGQHGAAFRLHYVSASTEVETSLGLPLGGLAPLPDALPDGAVVVAPGSTPSIEAYARPEARRVVAWVASHRHRTGMRWAGVCSGSLLLAEAGLFDGRACTSHHSLIERLRALAPAARVQENRVFVADGPCYSSAGITAGIDLALHLIAELAAPAVARAVAREMVVYFRRSPQDPELSPWLAWRNHLHPALHRAQDLICSDPVRDWPLDELAARVHVSARHLSRLFRDQAGVSAHDYHRALRLTLAEQWRSAGLSKEKAALSAGFSSARQMNRAAAAHD
ncbi:GlxA family transcriptional regulator [Chromobacterium violaceum]|uniref:GlxA family transcriptional regulator n=1 Tax=Chromobacterium violaceum TaxID=536 RepID=UPI0009F0F893|nr:helix-turn-helix domain-containing protein [Chromobacterium violaceum]OQS51263.1 AraC family transcriptional regulator [Chromobacterium violaceum]OQS53266.1 AraC family transcriptional regulator [Chromobacterium violaceum]QRO34461.1 DJ-1/PfpI family protein [Chromobacterium violaceum]QRQ15735.1 DJ-1/PfpI family protein [Chromobacterium violaceum]